ncbi:MAG: cyclo(L-leucyl-L-leucyl) synthase [Parvularculaceae bacterium]
MNAEPVTSACGELLAARRHVVLGVSPFNSYFSEARIAALIRWAAGTFERFSIYVPDGPSRYTLEALGCAPAKARKKAARQARWLFNKIRRALGENGFSVDAFSEIVLCSQMIDDNRAYRVLCDEVETRFAADAAFRSGCLETTRWVLEGHLESGMEATPEMLESAVRHFKAELPLFMDSAAIAGVASSVFAYHQCPDFLRSLYETRDAGLRPNQGFVIVRDG